MLNHAIHPLPLLCVAVRAVGSGRGRRSGRRAGGRCWGRGYLRARGTGLVAAVEPRRFVEAGVVARLDALDDKVAAAVAVHRAARELRDVRRDRVLRRGAAIRHGQPRLRGVTS